jgi:4-hydroxybenzoate polyprenyltransferase
MNWPKTMTSSASQAACVMSKGTWGALLIVLGLVLAMAGAGGVETSLDTLSMVQAFLLAMVGLVIMWLGTMTVNEHTDENLGRY